MLCVIKYVSDGEPGGFRAQLWAPAWTLGANLGKDLTQAAGRRSIRLPS